MLKDVTSVISLIEFKIKVNNELLKTNNDRLIKNRTLHVINELNSLLDDIKTINE